MALHFSSINPLLAVERAAARPPAAARPSAQTSLAKQELARTLAAAATSNSSTPATTTPASSGTTATAAVIPAATPATTAASTTATAATAAASTTASGPPTAQSVFGANPWEADPTGSGPLGTYNYNPYYFATPQTAAEVASMVGGTVVQVNCFSQSAGNPFSQNQPNEMVRLSNGTMLNPGLVASFYTHGYPQSMVDQMVASEVANVTKGT